MDIGGEGKEDIAFRRRNAFAVGVDIRFSAEYDGEFEPVNMRVRADYRATRTKPFADLVQAYAVDDTGLFVKQEL